MIPNLFFTLQTGMLRHGGAARDQFLGHGRASHARPGSDLPLVASTEPGEELERPVRRVLLPYSGSRTADAALDFVTGSGMLATAEVWVLYVRPYDVDRGGCYYLETPLDACTRAQLAASRLRLAGVACSAIVRDARRDQIASTILAEAAARNVSSIVLATRARGALSVALFGSTSATVARRSWRPVLVVKARPRAAQRVR
jgi:nucleotide-binding universal stress UspA family protein